MSFGNKPTGKQHSGNGNLEKAPLNALGLSKPSSDLEALNHLDGLGDLGSPAVNSRKNNGFNMGKLGQDSKHLNDDLRGLNGRNPGNALEKGIRDAGKLNRDAGNPLSSLNNLAGDLQSNPPAGVDDSGRHSRGDPNSDFEDLAKNPEKKDHDTPQEALNDLGTVGSLADAKRSKPDKKSAKEGLRDINRLNNDLKHPEKVKDPMKDLKAANDLKNGGLNALGFGPLEGPMKNAAQEGFGHDPLMDKVADGSIKPRDLYDPNLQQQKRDNRSSGLPPKGLFNHLKNGAHKAGRAIARGAKGAIHHVSQGIVGGVKMLTGKTIAQAVAVKAAVASMAIPVLIGGGAFGVLYHNYNDYQVLDAGNVCSTQNVGESYLGAIKAALSGGKKSGDSWTQPGSDQYKAAKAVAQKLKSMGFSGVAIAGIMGNMAQESKFNTSVLNGSGDGGKGLMQWTGNRRTELENFAKQHHMDSGSLKLQLMMMEHDLRKKDYWVSAYKPISPKILNHAKSPADAAMRFYLSQFEAGGGHASDPDGSGPNREAFAQQAYSLFHLSGIKGDDAKVQSLLGGNNAAVASSNAATAEKANIDNCKHGASGSDNADTSDIVKTAKALKGYFTYANSRPVPPNVTKNHSSDVKAHDMSAIDKHGTTDCSGYVWLVAKLAGYHPSWYAQTHAMTTAAEKGKGLKKISAGETKAGDVAITDGSGDDHTVILLEKYHGKGTKIINEGGSSNGPVHEETIGTAYGQYWNHYIFARMVKE